MYQGLANHKLWAGARVNFQGTTPNFAWITGPLTNVITYNGVGDISIAFSPTGGIAEQEATVIFTPISTTFSVWPGGASWQCVHTDVLNKQILSAASGPGAWAAADIDFEMLWFRRVG